LGHHGSKTSSSAEFVGYVSPEFAVVSAGDENRYGHPHQSVLDIVTGFDIPVLSTIERGTIVFKTNGKDIHIDK